jgi:hypothetical protein
VIGFGSQTRSLMQIPGRAVEGELYKISYQCIFISP